MVEDGVEFNSAIHCVEDMQVFHLRITHAENQFARAEVEVKNPKTGLLDVNRPRNVFISCEESPGSEDIVLLFAGRIVAYPSDMTSELATLEYLAQPLDYFAPGFGGPYTWQEINDGVNGYLQGQPQYNELLVPVDKRGELTETLAFFSLLPHWTRFGNGFTISNLIEGTVIDLEDNFFYDSLKSDFGDPPVSKINLTIEVQWNQIGVGEVDVAEAIRQQFTNSITTEPQINSLTPQSFEDGWQGARIPKGYELIESVLTPVADDFGLTQDDLSSSPATVSGTQYPTLNQATPSGRQVVVPRVWYKGRFNLLGTYEQKRREVVSVTLQAALQEYSPGTITEEDLFLRIENPVSNINGAVLDPSAPSFFLDKDTGELSAHGKAVIESAIYQARSRLVKGARTVETSFECDISDVLEISCDHTIHITDPRLPNSHLRGKVVAYQFDIDGNGTQFARVTLASIPGTGDNSIPSNAPNEHKLDSNGAEPEFFVNEQTHTVMSSAIYYNLTGFPAISEPIDVAQMESDSSYLIDGVTVENDGETQNTGFVASTTPDKYLEENRTRIVVDLKSLNPENEIVTNISITTQRFTLPRQVNLGPNVPFGNVILRGRGTLSATATADIYASAHLTGTGTIESTARFEVFLDGFADLTGAGILEAFASKEAMAFASLSGSGSMSATAEYMAPIPAFADLFGSGTMTANGEKEAAGIAVLSGTGSLTAVHEYIPPSGALYGWGRGINYSTGLGNVNYSSPVQVGTATNWRDVYQGSDAGVGIRADGTLWTWGINDVGQLGLGDTTARQSPVQVGTRTDWDYAATANKRVLVVDENNDAWAFGQGADYVLGTGTTSNQSSPVQIFSNVKHISIGTGHAGYIKTDGTLWMFGYNGSGELGNASFTTYSSPIQVGSDTDWAKIICGNANTLAMKDSGALWAIGGFNGSGELGLGHSTSVQSPVQIGTLTDWKEAHCMGTLFTQGQTCAIKNDGTLWTWGYNNAGQLGLGNITNRSSPVQVGTLTDWARVANGGSMMIATKTDGTLWAWGAASFGRLGNGTTSPPVSSPIQIGTSTGWLSVSGAQDGGTMGVKK